MLKKSLVNFDGPEYSQNSAKLDEFRGILKNLVAIAILKFFERNEKIQIESIKCTVQKM